jgi:hypothetical protein
MTLEFQNLDELIFSKSFFAEVVSAEVYHHWTRLTSANSLYAFPRSDGSHSVQDFGALAFG